MSKIPTILDHLSHSSIRGYGSHPWKKGFLHGLHYSRFITSDELSTLLDRVREEETKSTTHHKGEKE